MSKPKTENKKSNIRDIELPPNAVKEVPVEAVEPSEAERILEASRPYWTQIALGICVLLLGYVLVSYFLQNSQNAAAEPWQELDRSINQFRISQNVDSLKQMENDYPNDRATNFALQMAGDYEMNRGLQQLPTDREGAMKLIKDAKESFQKVYDAPSTTKTVMQQRRSLFTLAYAAESLGEFDEAKELYTKYTDEAPDSLLYNDAQRGLARVTNPKFVALYKEFQDYDAFEEEAPGAAVEDAPNIDFPEIDISKEMEEAKEPADSSVGFEAVKPMTKSAEVKEVEVKKVEVIEETKPAGSETKVEEAAPVQPAGESSIETPAPVVTTTEGTIEAVVEPAVTTTEGTIEAVVEPAVTTTEGTIEAVVEPAVTTVEGAVEAVVEPAVPAAGE